MSWPSPSFAWSQRRRSSAISSARPTKRRQAADNPAIEAPARCAFTCDAPQPHRIRDALEFVQPELLVIERGTGETMGQFRHHHGIGRCHSLNPCGQVQCLSDCDAFLRAALADQLAYHHHGRWRCRP